MEEGARGRMKLVAPPRIVVCWCWRLCPISLIMVSNLSLLNIGVKLRSQCWSRNSLYFSVDTVVTSQAILEAFDNSLEGF